MRLFRFFMLKIIRNQFLLGKLMAILFIIWWNSIPENLFENNYATIIEDRDEKLLTAIIASDGQWRFPINDSVPFKFEQAILCFEDESFYTHLGVSIRGLTRALIQNTRNLRKVSGGSTLTMQLMRMSRQKKSRSIWQKILEIMGATRLEFRMKKHEILAMYAAHAPMGGNVVGLDAASWRYFGRSAFNLTWAESATLAVLPNSPALIHPGKNRKLLWEKRNRLLHKLFEKGKITAEELELALLESLPDKPFSMPQKTPHLLNRVINQGQKGQRIQTTIDGNLQELIQQSVNHQMNNLRHSFIHNAAVVVMDNQTGEVLAYIGNAMGNADEIKNSSVDVIPAARSSGSILKPFLFCHSLEEGVITPKTLLTDVPTYMNGYAPKNYYDQYDGLVPANEALARSLNVPFVRLLIKYNQRKFLDKLKRDGFTNFVFSADHYGTSLILGGAEVSLEDLVSVYSNLGNSALGKSESPNFHITQNVQSTNQCKFNQSAAYHTLNAMLSVNRPDLYGNWERYEQPKRVAWKTGTSFGFRDAWAVGVTPQYTVGVWVGNADGEGRPGIIGVKAAAPLLFEAFNFLTTNEWFLQPFDDETEIAICKQSGMRSNENCKEIEMVSFPKNTIRSALCTYHKMVHLNKNSTEQLSYNCAKNDEIRDTSWFIVPPLAEKYFKMRNPNYQPLPPFRDGCGIENVNVLMDIIYPKKESTINVPKGFTGEYEQIILEATHRLPDAVIYWHLNEQYLGSTTEIHQVKCIPSVGVNTLQLIDQAGNVKVLKFKVN